LLSIFNNSFASGGGEEPEDFYISATRPDCDLDVYQSCNLGAVLPSYPRICLYPASRAIMLGSDDLKKEPVIAGALNKFCCNYVSSWTDDRNANNTKPKWAEIRATVTTELPTVRLLAEPYDAKHLNHYYSYQSCSNESYGIAAATLVELKPCRRHIRTLKAMGGCAGRFV